MRLKEALFRNMEGHTKPEQKEAQHGRKPFSGTVSEFTVMKFVQEYSHPRLISYTGSN
jgi:hypothetical protein